MAQSNELTLAEVAQRLDARAVAAADRLYVAVAGGLVSDLLSYVMANGRPGQVWITIQTHPNIVAVATLARLAGVLIASGFQPNQTTIARADEEGIPILVSPDPAFVLAGKLWEMGVR
ncbi:MAG: DRTGG domain-containing protein [Armatimonadetes bacterium]|nr:DRTGG domain-containing protein [Armatimonadota bacterium]